jgi:hypothetical protein
VGKEESRQRKPGFLLDPGDELCDAAFLCFGEAGLDAKRGPVFPLASVN